MQQKDGHFGARKGFKHMLKSDQNEEDTLQRPSMCVASCFNHENTSVQVVFARKPHNMDG